MCFIISYASDRELVGFIQVYVVSKEEEGFPLAAIMASVLASKMGLNSLRRKQAKTFNVTVVTMDADLEFSCEVSSKCFVFMW